MEYIKHNLKQELDKLVGETINKIFYIEHNDDYESNFSNEKKTISILQLGILLETTSGKSFQFIDTDYSPYFGLGGIEFQKKDNPHLPELRIQHFPEQEWISVKNKKIVGFKIIESIYITDAKKIVIPFGVKLQFENDFEVCIVNASIESFDIQNKMYEISRGLGLLIFFGKEEIQKYNLLDEATFNL